MADAVTLDVLIQIREELAGLNRTREGLQNAKKDAEGFGTALKQGLGIGTGMQTVAGAVALLRNSLQATVGTALRMAGETKDTAEAIGITTSLLQTLRLEFKAAGADAGRLTEAFSAQTRSLAAARDPASAAAQAYRDLGLEATIVERLPIDQRLYAVARAVENAADKTSAFAAASEILGARGLLPMLNALKRIGSEGVEALQALYEKQGLIMGSDTIERLDKAEKQWAKLWHAIVIGSGEALATLGQFGEAAKKDWLGTLRYTLGAGTPFGAAMLTSWVGANSSATAGNGKSNTPASSDALATAQARAQMTADLLARSKTTVEELERLFKAGAATTADSLTPLEKYISVIKSINDQLNVGAISHETYRHAVAKAAEILSIAKDGTEAETAALRAQGEEIRRSLLTPLDQFGATLRQLDALQRAGTISAEEYARAASAAYKDFNRNEHPRPEGLLGGYGSFLTSLGTQSQQTADLLSQGLGTAINSLGDDLWEATKGTQGWGEAWKNLGNIAGRMLTQMITQMLVVSAINSALGFFGFEIKNPGGSTGTTISKVPKVVGAGGGTFLTHGPTQFTVGDNPGGVELVSVRPLSGIGRSTINGRAIAMAGGGSALVSGGGASLGRQEQVIIHQTNNFASGVSREDFLGAMPALVETTKHAVFDQMRRRRGGW